jgi:site-specific recombinase XerD
MRTPTLTALVQSFLAVALPRRGFSGQTVLSYRDALKLLLRFASERTSRPVVQLEFADLDDAMVAPFLDQLESKRGNQIATRNNRLAALRSFFAFVAAEEPVLAEQSRRVCALPLKRAPIRSIPYLEHEEMQAILAVPDLATASGRRDHALLLFLYNTGARVQELIGVRAADLQLVRQRQVLLRGKRNKERICPLWKTTADALVDLLEEAGIPSGSERRVFLSGRNEPLSASAWATFSRSTPPQQRRFFPRWRESACHRTPSATPRPCICSTPASTSTSSEPGSATSICARRTSMRRST